MGGIIRHAKAVVARSLDNVQGQAKESQEMAKASKSAIELVGSDQDIHKPSVYNFLQLPSDGSRRPSIDEELNNSNLHPSVFIRVNDLVNSSRRSSFTDVSRRSSVFSRLSDLINSSRRPSVTLISSSRPGSIYDRFSRYGEASLDNQVQYPTGKHTVLFLGLIVFALFSFVCYHIFCS
jgi:hypothetical protein